MNAEAARDALRTLETGRPRLPVAGEEAGPGSPAWQRRQPLELDFEAAPDPPRDVVEGCIERQAVTVLSGDTGSAKTIAVNHLAVVAACQGGQWLGRAVSARRPLVVDEENPPGLVRARLRALGMTNADREALRYFNRIGTRLGDGDWAEWLMHEAEQHAADLVVIDTAMAATRAEVNNNDEVAALYAEVLRPLAARLDAGVVLLHHERKPQMGQSRDAGQAMMGARQWAGQADVHLSIAVAGPLLEEPAESGHRRLRRPFTLRMPKSRDGEPDVPETVVVTSEKDPARRLLWMRVESEGRSESPADRTEAVVRAIAEAVSESGVIRSGQLAAQVGLSGKDGTYTRARDRAVAEGLIRQVGYGQYGPPEATPELGS